MMHLVDLAEHQIAKSDLAAVEALRDVANRIADGDLQGLHGLIVGWINPAGMVDYAHSANIGMDSVLAIVGPVQMAASWSLWQGDMEDGDAN